MVKKTPDGKKIKTKSNDIDVVRQLQQLGGATAAAVVLLAALAAFAKSGWAQAAVKKDDTPLNSKEAALLKEALQDELRALKEKQLLLKLQDQLHLHGDSAGTVEELSANVFDQTMFTYPQGVLVDFYIPSCPHCSKLLPEFEAAALELKGVAPLMKVDCSVHSSTCQENGVTRYPTLKWFRRGLNVLEASPGTRFTDKIVKWVKWASEDALTSFDTVAELSESIDAIRELTLPNTSVVVAYAPKDESVNLRTTFEIIAEMLRGKTAFIYVQESSPDGVLLRAYDRSPEADKDFAGEPSAGEILRWIASFMEIRNKWDIEIEKMES
eukprot:TRINITY_DN49378_c0_g1_i1.p1 TRINITY_DN49378_c0_g1~~TRINITY_DN49378_c0_g1_i1.p1  ORF type:complete len:326 (+),score=62.97 TRINITY_DN49378_c0_g1_i1:57-1034(+)